MSVAADRADRGPQEIGDTLGHGGFGSAVVDPGAYALGLAVGKLEIYLDHDSSLIEREGDGDGGGRVFGRWFGRGLSADAYGEGDDGEGEWESHGVIVMG